jgi:hypothetical protein
VFTTPSIFLCSLYIYSSAEKIIDAVDEFVIPNDEQLPAANPEATVTSKSHEYGVRFAALIEVTVSAVPPLSLVLKVFAALKEAVGDERISLPNQNEP